MDSFDFRLRLTPAAAALAACLAAPVGAAMAFAGFCSGPRVPSCLSAPGGFADERAASSCRAQLESYLSAVERRAICVLQLAEEEARQRVEEGRREAVEVRDEGREAVARFECKARGNTC